ncbi:MAG: universal stress protein [Acidobacteriota bacterium]
MVEIQRIVCPTDFSEFSSRALDHALAVACWYKAEVSVVHVVPRFLMHPEFFPYVQEPVVPDVSIRKRATRELGKFVHKAREAGIATEVRLEDGDTVKEIVEIAKKLPADMIVMGTHGRRGFEKLVLGSVAEKILRKAPCPVLTVSRTPEKAPVPETVLYKKILCPVDFSPSSTKALEYAMSLAQEAEARLILLNVVEFFLPPEIVEQESLGLEQHRAHLHRDAEERLSRSVPKEAREWLDVEELVVAGRSYREILKVAEGKEVELIVMGVQGRSTLDLMVFGSTTQHVVREAICPVLTIRSE